MNNDGVTDLVVGAPYDDDGGTDRGAIWILFMNSNGTAAAQQKISINEGLFAGNLQDSDYFGIAVDNVGDLDDDGIIDLAVGTSGVDDAGSDRGGVWILFLNSNGTVGVEQRISQSDGFFDWRHRKIGAF